ASSLIYTLSLHDALPISLGLLASLIKPLNKLKISFPLGMYFIIVFCLALSSMANLSEMFQLEFLQLFLYVCWVIVGSMIIHVLRSEEHTSELQSRENLVC